MSKLRFLLKIKPTEPLLNMFEKLWKAGKMYTSRGLANVDAILKAGGRQFL